MSKFLNESFDIIIDDGLLDGMLCQLERKIGERNAILATNEIFRVLRNFGVFISLQFPIENKRFIKSFLTSSQNNWFGLNTLNDNNNIQQSSTIIINKFSQIFSNICYFKKDSNLIWFQKKITN
eukprot:c20138_g1_i1.p1 GENE.c20138_g1_i1~~c20138_g1_i1.p1  ORF type:complete len:124 (+),score=43.14 c20138_g1_i1:344-715(+)